MIKEVKYFFQEHIENSHTIMKLAVSSAKQATAKTTLGIYWNLVKDIVFFIAYSFFIIVVRSGSKNPEGTPKVIFLIIGLVAWYVLNDTLTSGIKCMVKNKNIYTKIKFPIMIIPTFETIAIFYRRILTFILLIIILFVFTITTSFKVELNIIGIIYAIIGMFIFSLSYNLFISGFYTISKDFRELYQALVRIQLYFVPVFWSIYDDLPAQTPKFLVLIIKNNPLVHLINTFRRAITHGALPRLSNVIVFLIIVLILFMLGCFIQYRLRKVYSDFA
ncbi:MAG: ABC transporter permease [Bacilli bacterium]